MGHELLGRAQNSTIFGFPPRGQGHAWNKPSLLTWSLCIVSPAFCFIPALHSVNPSSLSSSQLTHHFFRKARASDQARPPHPTGHSHFSCRLPSKHLTHYCHFISMSNVYLMRFPHWKHACFPHEVLWGREHLKSPEGNAPFCFAYLSLQCLAASGTYGLLVEQMNEMIIWNTWG